MKRIVSILSLFMLLACLPSWAQSLRDSLPGNIRNSYIKAGEQYLGKAWNTLPALLFSQFKKNGNRTNYESVFFQRRKQLGVLVMAEIMEGKNRFLPDIINGMEAMMEETWWGLPAHYNRPLPDPDIQPVDLFNAESASLLVWSAKELRPQLDKFSPDICKRVEKEVQRRILRPALGSHDWWKTASMNWNPWISSNWLSCVLLCERDSVKRDAAIKEIEGCMDAFISKYPADGGCDEGAGYWDHAAASLYDCMQQLHDAGIDDSRYHDSEKVRNMAAYIYRMYIGNGWYVDFADAHQNRDMAQLNAVYPFALYLGDETMRGFASYIAKRKDFFNDPAALYLSSGDIPTLARELRLLRRYAELSNEKAVEPKTESWLSDLQVMTLRSYDKRKEGAGLFLAVKGGNNGESHNHNDVGSFIVYADGEPLLIDPAVGEYTSKTFSKQRYSIWTMQSQYHNLPQVNGIDEHDGKEYSAVVKSRTSRSITLDITKAYPAEAGINHWYRTVTMKGTAISVTDDYSLAACSQPIREMLMTTVTPDISKPGIIALGSHSISYPRKSFDVRVEDISDHLDPVLTKLWGNHLYRIVLETKNTPLNFKVNIVVK